MDKCSSNHKSHRDSKKEANPHVPFIHLRVGGEAMIIWILANQRPTCSRQLEDGHLVEAEQHLVRNGLAKVDTSHTSFLLEVSPTSSIIKTALIHNNDYAAITIQHNNHHFTLIISVKSFWTNTNLSKLSGYQYGIEDENTSLMWFHKNRNSICIFLQKHWNLTQGDYVITMY